MLIRRLAIASVVGTVVLTLFADSAQAWRRARTPGVAGKNYAVMVYNTTQHSCSRDGLCFGTEPDAVAFSSTDTSSTVLYKNDIGQTVGAGWYSEWVFWKKSFWQAEIQVNGMPAVATEPTEFNGEMEYLRGVSYKCGRFIWFYGKNSNSDRLVGFGYQEVEVEEE